jgi:hypothetical protein
VRGDGAGVITGGSVTRKGGEIAGVDAADRWVPPVIGGRGEKLTPSGFWPGGPWASSEAGPNGFPGAFYPFLISFSFSVLPFLLYLLQKCFKSIQTTFNFFKKIQCNDLTLQEN